MRDYDPTPQPEFLKYGIETNKICFLITKDQKPLLLETWRFPYAGQWNPNSPFQRIKEIEIKNTSGITNLVVELEEGCTGDD